MYKRQAVEASANGFGGALSVLVGFDKEGNIIDYSLSVSYTHLVEVAESKSEKQIISKSR